MAEEEEEGGTWARKRSTDAKDGNSAGDSGDWADGDDHTTPLRSITGGVHPDPPANGPGGATSSASGSITYVDEDVCRYYLHALGTDAVRALESPHLCIHGFQEVEEQATLLVPCGADGFEDTKLCRVREVDEPGPFGNIAFDKERREFLRDENKCRRDHWFEIASRFGA